MMRADGSLHTLQGEPHTSKASFGVPSGLLGGLLQHAGTPCSPVHPQHRPVSPKEQMAEQWEGGKGEWSL